MKLGGICGDAVTSTVISCRNMRMVDYTDENTGDIFIGGICGSYGYISHCYNTGEIRGKQIVSCTSKGHNFGGVVGSDAYKVEFCHNSCKVIGERTSQGGVFNIGGIPGSHTGSGTFACCYNAGEVIASGTDIYIGGVVGTNGCSMANCYNAGMKLCLTDGTTGEVMSAFVSAGKSVQIPVVPESIYTLELVSQHGVVFSRRKMLRMRIK